VDANGAGVANVRVVIGGRCESHGGSGHLAGQAPDADCLCSATAFAAGAALARSASPLARAGSAPWATLHPRCRGSQRHAKPDRAGQVMRRRRSRSRWRVARLRGRYRSAIWWAEEATDSVLPPRGGPSLVRHSARVAGGSCVCELTGCHCQQCGSGEPLGGGESGVASVVRRWCLSARLQGGPRGATKKPLPGAHQHGVRRTIGCGLLEAPPFERARGRGGRCAACFT